MFRVTDLGKNHGRRKKKKIDNRGRAGSKGGGDGTMAFKRTSKIPIEQRRTREWEIIIPIAQKYNLCREDIYLLLALREIENGPHNREYNVKAVRGLKDQADWVAHRIRDDRLRYVLYVQDGQYKGRNQTLQLLKGEEPKSFLHFFCMHGGMLGDGWEFSVVFVLPSEVRGKPSVVILMELKMAEMEKHFKGGKNGRDLKTDEGNGRESGGSDSHDKGAASEAQS